mmetsp:Transcript_11491/g.24094  ORF Transcript_11491/g.24094 Transcript_11491/m.24094 type:complete len:238 (+) Transcript_11491:234-947(+)
MFWGFRSCTPEMCTGCSIQTKDKGTVGVAGNSTGGSSASGGGGLCPAPEAECPRTLHSESGAVPRLPPRGLSGASRLTVPTTFTRFQFSVIYTQLGATQGTLMEQQRSMLQTILKHFTKELSHGVMLSVVDHNGRGVDYRCSLDRTMSQLTMLHEESGVTQALVFRDVERVCSPEEVRNLRAGSATPLWADECSTTVVLTGQRFVTFRMESVAAREYLMLCIQVLRMSQDKARMWYP